MAYGLHVGGGHARHTRRCVIGNGGLLARPVVVAELVNHGLPGRERALEQSHHLGVQGTGHGHLRRTFDQQIDGACRQTAACQVADQPVQNSVCSDVVVDFCARDCGQHAAIVVDRWIGLALHINHRHRRAAQHQVLRQTHGLGHLLVGLHDLGRADAGKAGARTAGVPPGQAQFANGHLGQHVDADAVGAGSRDDSDRTQVGVEVFGGASGFVDIVVAGVLVAHLDQHRAHVPIAHVEREGAIGVHSARGQHRPVGLVGHGL